MDPVLGFPSPAAGPVWGVRSALDTIPSHLLSSIPLLTLGFLPPVSCSLFGGRCAVGVAWDLISIHGLPSRHKGAMEFKGLSTK